MRFKLKNKLNTIFLIMLVLMTTTNQLYTKAQGINFISDAFNGIWKTSLISNSLSEDVSILLCVQNGNLNGTLTAPVRDYEKLPIINVKAISPSKILGTIIDKNEKSITVRLSILKSGEMQASFGEVKSVLLEKISSNSCNFISSSSTSSSSTSSGVPCSPGEIKCSTGACVKNSAACLLSDSTCNLPTPFICPTGECKDFTGSCKSFKYDGTCLCSDFAKGGPWCKARPLDCSSAYSPVCACDGVTHFNACTATFARNRTFTLGACINVTKAIKCTGNKPVECANGTCVARIRDCGEGLSAVGCSEPKSKACDDGRCVSDYANCEPSLFDQINLKPPK